MNRVGKRQRKFFLLWWALFITNSAKSSVGFTLRKQLAFGGASRRTRPTPATPKQKRDCGSFVMRKAPMSGLLKLFGGSNEGSLGVDLRRIVWSSAPLLPTTESSPWSRSSALKHFRLPSSFPALLPVSFKLLPVSFKKWISCSKNKNRNKKLLGRSLLLFVAFLYGILYVCLRRVYALSSPPTAAALSATRGWLAALCFLHVPFQAKRRKTENAATTDAYPSPKKPSSRLLWLTAFDLAMWNFVAQGLTNLGLVYCPSARVAFLIQASVIFTPLLSLGAGQKVARPLWLGVGLAFTGLSVLALGGGEAAASTANASSSTLLGGIGSLLKSTHSADGIVLAGALCWSVYLIRLSSVSSAANNKDKIDFPAVPLQAIKTLLLAIMYTIWWALNTFLNNTATATATALGTTPWWTSGAAWFWLALSAIGPGAVADVLQQKGHQHVCATEANVIMSSEPVFTAVSGFLLLGEKLAGSEVVAGAIILLAALVSSVSS